MKYTQRLNALKPTTTWELVKAGFVWSDDKGDAGEISWRKIKSVRLRLEPSRAETRRVAMHIHAPYPYTITNIHYKGVMSFKVQKDEFRDFVLAFHERFPKDSQTIFHKGSTQAAYIGNVVTALLLLAFLFLLAPLLSLTGIPGAGSIARILIIIIFIPTLLKLLIKNKPDTYDPNHVPLDMLK
ncbi:MAG: hypothetical protein JKX72_02740 [Robiginitomaculum sp.]|nr:hypothetical protein [Robiginitomaculum sp.]